MPGNTEMEQLSLINKLLGPPTDENWPKMRLLPRYSGLLAFRGENNAIDTGDLSLEKRFKGVTIETVNILKDLLQWDPEKRLSAKKALDHRWFKFEEPKPKSELLMPTFPEVRRTEDVDEMSDAMPVEDDDRGWGAVGKTGYGSGGKSVRGGDEGGKGKRHVRGGGGGAGGREDYGSVAEGGGAAASMAEKVMKRGAEQVGKGGGGGFLFDFGVGGYSEPQGDYTAQGGRQLKKSRH